MPLTPQILAQQLNILAGQDITPEEANVEFANIITEYIKTAQVNVTGSGTGANGGGAIATVVTGQGTIQ